MKKRNVKVAVTALAAVGCMSTSAMAIEHEFNGLLRVKGIFTNFDQAGGNDASTGSLSAGNLGKSFFYTEQRARLKYTGTLTKDVKVVTHFEIDSRWGDTSQQSTSTRNIGGAMEADQVNLETKNVYMQFKVPYLPTTARIGIQPVDDMYKGIFVGTDAAAVSTVTKLDKATIHATWMRGYDNKNFKGANETVPAVNAGTNGNGGTGSMPGRYSLDSFLFDVKYDVNKNLKVGGSYYMVYENLVAGYNVLNTLGANAAYNFGRGTVDGFFLYQVGDNPVNNFGQTGEKVSAFAANIGGKIKAGPGTARANLLYASGDNGTGKVNAFQGLNQLGSGNTTSTFSAAQMTMLITNTKYAANTDRGLINTITNNNQGVKGAFLGYDVDIDKTFIKGNVGAAAVAQRNQNSRANLKGGSNGSYIGTEINAEVGYRISENLTASWVGGYVFLGDYFKDTASVNGVIKTPDNPWKNMVVFNLAF